MHIPLDPATVKLVHQLYDPIVADAGLPTSAIDDALATFDYYPKALGGVEFRHAIVDHLARHLKPLIREAEREVVRRAQAEEDAYLASLRADRNPEIGAAFALSPEELATLERIPKEKLIAIMQAMVAEDFAALRFLYAQMRLAEAQCRP